MSAVDSDSETLDDGISVIHLDASQAKIQMEAEKKKGSKEGKTESKRLSLRVEQVSWWITEHTVTANIYLFTQKSSLHHSACLSISSVCVCVCFPYSTVTVYQPSEHSVLLLHWGRKVEEWWRSRNDVRKMEGGGGRREMKVKKRERRWLCSLR